MLKLRYAERNCARRYPVALQFAKPCFANCITEFLHKVGVCNALCTVKLCQIKNSISNRTYSPDNKCSVKAYKLCNAFTKSFLYLLISRQIFLKQHIQYNKRITIYQDTRLTKVRCALPIARSFCILHRNGALRYNLQSQLYKRDVKASLYQDAQLLTKTSFW